RNMLEQTKKRGRPKGAVEERIPGKRDQLIRYRPTGAKRRCGADHECVPWSVRASRCTLSASCWATRRLVRQTALDNVAQQKAEQLTSNSPALAHVPQWGHWHAASDWSKNVALVVSR